MENPNLILSLTINVRNPKHVDVSPLDPEYLTTLGVMRLEVMAGGTPVTMYLSRDVVVKLANRLTTWLVENELRIVASDVEALAGQEASS